MCLWEISSTINKNKMSWWIKSVCDHDQGPERIQLINRFNKDLPRTVQNWQSALPSHPFLPRQCGGATQILAKILSSVTVPHCPVTSSSTKSPSSSRANWFSTKKIVLCLLPEHNGESALSAAHSVRIMTWKRCEGRRKLEDQITDVYKNLCTGAVD